MTYKTQDEIIEYKDHVKELTLEDILNNNYRKICEKAEKESKRRIEECKLFKGLAAYLNNDKCFIFSDSSIIFTANKEEIIIHCFCKNKDFSISENSGPKITYIKIESNTETLVFKLEDGEYKCYFEEENRHVSFYIQFKNKSINVDADY